MKWIILGSIAPALGLAEDGADAQSWPDRPVHVVVPLTAGSAADVMARIVAKQLSQPFIVESKPGAGGAIGTAAVARAKPDGYSLLVQSVSCTVSVPSPGHNFRVGLFMPSGTPREILDGLYAETARAIESPELRQGMANLGVEANLIEPDAYNRQLEQEIVDNAGLVKAAGIPIGGAQ